ncbi:hypothetical protein ACSYAD_27955 [Acaryochloris marina NIES-2412]|uniref:hypothetical protein n=1 Tax=Acaryochloris marina TaxID=155978 RepID=UPI0040580740
MAITNAFQTIASESAQMAVDKFLQTLPSELLDQLPQDFIDDVGDDLQADIQSCIHSRLQWSLQSAQSEIDEQQQQQQHHQPQSQHQINFLPPEPIQKLPEKGLGKHQQASRHIIQQPVALDNPVHTDNGATHSYIDEGQSQLPLSNSPNRHRRRRRRSAAAEYQESLLSST